MIAKTVHVPRRERDGRYTETLWHLKRSEDGGLCYERGIAVDITDAMERAKLAILARRRRLLGRWK